MKCIPLPEVDAPALSGGISVQPTIPAVTFDAGICCKTLPFNPIPAPIPLTPVITATISATMGPAISAIQDWLDNLPLRCPRE